MEERFTVRMLREAAESLGLTYFVEPDYRHVGYIESKEEKRLFFKLSALDINQLGSARIATDKAYTQFFLQKFGYPTIPTELFFSDEWCTVNNTRNNFDAALEYVQKAGYPRIVKPNSKSQGRGVAKVYTEEELRAALAEIFAIDTIALIQPFVEGTDYRIVVYKDEVMMAYGRSPLTITGDGKKKVREFVTVHKASLSVIETRLTREYSLNLDCVPHDGQVLQLLDNANLSTGGTATDVTDRMHESIKEIAIKAVRDMGLTFAGVDLLTTSDITRPVLEYSMVEINAMPGLEHYAELGGEQLSRVRTLYRKIVQDYLHA